MFANDCMCEVCGKPCDSSICVECWYTEQHSDEECYSLARDLPENPFTVHARADEGVGGEVLHG